MNYWQLTTFSGPVELGDTFFCFVVAFESRL